MAYTMPVRHNGKVVGVQTIDHNGHSSLVIWSTNYDHALSEPAADPPAKEPSKP